MRRYEIPDIRVFWSQDSGVTSQFEGVTPEMKISYQVNNKFFFQAVIF